MESKLEGEVTEILDGPQVLTPKQIENPSNLLCVASAFRTDATITLKDVPSRVGREIGDRKCLIAFARAV